MALSLFPGPLLRVDHCPHRLSADVACPGELRFRLLYLAHRVVITAAQRFHLPLLACRGSPPSRQNLLQNVRVEDLLGTQIPYVATDHHTNRISRTSHPYAHR